MSHFNIYQLTTRQVDKSHWVKPERLVDDVLVGMRSDYIDGPAKDRGNELRILRRELEPFAAVDVSKGTITFKSKAIVTRTLSNLVWDMTREFLTDLEFAGKPSLRSFRKGAENLVDTDALFHMDYAMTLSQVVEDYLCGYLPRTLHVGSIVTAHC